jgi:hypothetical protein
MKLEAWPGLSGSELARLRSKPGTARSRSAQFGLGLSALVWANALAAAEPEPSLEPLTRSAQAAFQVRAPEPQWDVGFTLGGGFYEAQGSLDHGAFLLGLEADTLFFRRRETDAGLGLGLRALTVHFRDTRLALGPHVLLPFFDPLLIELGFRALLVADGSGVSPGFSPELRFGLRSLNLTNHYGHAHFIGFGSDFSFAVNDADDRARTTLYLTLRLDSMWLVAPLRALF